MAEIVGIYDHERSENLDGYMKAVGVPYIGRKMACASSPRLKIERNGEEWKIQNVTVLYTTEVTFFTGVEYVESMPFGVRIKSVTNLEENSLITKSSDATNGSLITRRYDFTNEGVTVTMTHEESGQVAKRFYKRTRA